MFILWDYTDFSVVLLYIIGLIIHLFLFRTFPIYDGPGDDAFLNNAVRYLLHKLKGKNFRMG